MRLWDGVVDAEGGGGGEPSLRASHLWRITHCSNRKLRLARGILQWLIFTKKRRLSSGSSISHNWCHFYKLWSCEMLKNVLTPSLTPVSATMVIVNTYKLNIQGFYRKSFGDFWTDIELKLSTQNATLHTNIQQKSFFIKNVSMDHFENNCWTWASVINTIMLLNLSIISCTYLYTQL